MFSFCFYGGYVLSLRKKTMRKRTTNRAEAEGRCCNKRKPKEQPQETKRTTAGDRENICRKQTHQRQITNTTSTDMNYANRRTIRRYTEQDVPQELLKEMLALASRASNTGNMQTYSVVVTRDKALKEQLAPAHFRQPMGTEAPVVLTFCVDYNRFSKWCEQREAEPGFDNFQSFTGAAIDTALFAQTFANIAEEHGLGLCYLGTTTYNAADIIRVLHLPKRVVPLCTITLGYPAEMPEQQDRLPIDSILHKETYHDYAEADIDRAYREKEALPSSAGFIAENKKKTLAQVFAEVRYPKAGNEQSSEKFLQVLREQLFL